jgi:hypothetical protein
LDGIRYCLEITDLAFSRLTTALNSFHNNEPSQVETEALIVAATSDAWMMIDSVHRLRELVQQTPGIKQNDPDVQMFLRKTEVVEELRHFVQHFRSGINDYVDQRMPLWGTVSWIEENGEQGLPVNHLLLPGTFFGGTMAPAITFDTWTGKYVERLALNAGRLRIDLDDLHERVVAFSGWYKDWFAIRYSGQQTYDADRHFRFIITLHSGPTAGESSGE